MASRQNTCCAFSNCDFLWDFVFVKYVNFISTSLRWQSGDTFISHSESRVPHTCSVVSTSNSTVIEVFIERQTQEVAVRLSQSYRLRSCWCLSGASLYFIFQFTTLPFFSAAAAWSHAEPIKLKAHDLYNVKEIASESLLFLFSTQVRAVITQNICTAVNERFKWDCN